MTKTHLSMGFFSLMVKVYKDPRLVSVRTVI